MSAEATHDHGHDHGDGGHGGGHHEHIHPPSHYVKIWGVLCVLLTVSVLGPMVGIKILTLITAFGIAFVKAGIVIKYFMHLDTEKPIVWYALITSLVFMVLFFAAVSPDVMNHHGTRWENVAAKAEVERGLAAGSGHHEGAEHEGAAHEGAAHEAAPAGEGH